MPTPLAQLIVLLDRLEHTGREPMIAAETRRRNRGKRPRNWNLRGVAIPLEPIVCRPPRRPRAPKPNLF